MFVQLSCFFASRNRNYRLFLLLLSWNCLRVRFAFFFGHLFSSVSGLFSFLLAFIISFFTFFFFSSPYSSPTSSSSSSSFLSSSSSSSSSSSVRPIVTVVVDLCIKFHAVASLRTASSSSSSSSSLILFNMSQFKKEKKKKEVIFMSSLRIQSSPHQRKKYHSIPHQRTIHNVSVRHLSRQPHVRGGYVSARGLLSQKEGLSFWLTQKRRKLPPKKRPIHFSAMIDSFLTCTLFETDAESGACAHSNLVRLLFISLSPAPFFWGGEGGCLFCFSFDILGGGRGRTICILYLVFKSCVNVYTVFKAA